MSRENMSGEVKIEELEFDSASQSDDDNWLVENKMLVLRISKSQDTSLKGFLQSREGFPIFFEREGEVRQVKTHIASDKLPKALSAIGEDDLIIDSESGQKPENDAKILEKLSKILGDKKKVQLLAKRFDALTSEENKSIDPKVLNFADKAFAQAAKINPTFQSLSTQQLFKNLQEGLVWKLNNICDAKGMGGKYVANLLAVEENGVSFSRSARFNSEKKITSVANAALNQELAKFYKFSSVLKTKTQISGLTKEEAQALNRELKAKGIHLHVDMGNYTDEVIMLKPELLVDINFISAMDSEKGGESKFWKALDESHEALSNNKAAIKTKVDGFQFSLGMTLLTESSQSSFGGGAMASTGYGSKNKILKRNNQLKQRFEILQEQIANLGGDCFSPAFTKFVNNPTEYIQQQRELLNIQAKDQSFEGFLSANFNGAEQAFMDYYITCELNNKHRGAFDQMFPAPTNVFTLEMGDIAFAELTGIHDHVSCKSGQDRTLTLVSLRSAVAKCGWPDARAHGLRSIYKDNFVAEFCATVANEAKAVVEHARGEGGKLKYNLGELVNEQPVPGAIFYYLESPEAQRLREQFALNNELRNGLKTVKLPAGKLKSALVGIENNVGEVDIELIGKTVGEYSANQDVTTLLVKGFSKTSQSDGKKKLLENFQLFTEIAEEFKELKEDCKDLEPEAIMQVLAEFKVKAANRLADMQEVSPGFAASSAKAAIGYEPLTEKLDVIWKKCVASLLEQIGTKYQDANKAILEQQKSTKQAKITQIYLDLSSNIASLTTLFKAKNYGGYIAELMVFNENYQSLAKIAPDKATECKSVYAKYNALYLPLTASPKPDPKLFTQEYLDNKDNLCLLLQHATMTDPNLISRAQAREILRNLCDIEILKPMLQIIVCNAFGIGNRTNASPLRIYITQQIVATEANRQIPGFFDFKDNIIYLNYAIHKHQKLYTSQMLQGALIHEMHHAIEQYLNNNNCLPYAATVRASLQHKELLEESQTIAATDHPDLSAIFDLKDYGTDSETLFLETVVRPSHALAALIGNKKGPNETEAIEELSKIAPKHWKFFQDELAKMHDYLAKIGIKQTQAAIEEDMPLPPPRSNHRTQGSTITAENQKQVITKTPLTELYQLYQTQGLVDETGRIKIRIKYADDPSKVVTKFISFDDNTQTISVTNKSGQIESLTDTLAESLNTQASKMLELNNLIMNMPSNQTIQATGHTIMKSNKNNDIVVLTPKNETQDFSDLKPNMVDTLLAVLTQKEPCLGL